MKVVKFVDSSEHGNTRTEQFEFSSDSSDADIQNEFENWVWERIGDNYNWEEIAPS